MTDHELMERFEDGTLSIEHFHHREHVRAAFLYLTEYPVLEALQAFSRALRKFAEFRGKPQLYHATVTWAYVFLIHERMARGGNQPGWEEFARNNPDLLTWKDGILTRYYRAETLASDLAKTIFVLPDLLTLNSRYMNGRSGRDRSEMPVQEEEREPRAEESRPLPIDKNCQLVDSERQSSAITPPIVTRERP